MARTAAPLLEALESRRLLSIPDSPPDISLLEDPENPVVRFETDLGRIDIEVLASDAPIAAANFIQRIEAGLTDLSFFHSLTPDTTPDALGGGLYKLDGGQPSLLTQTLGIDAATARTNAERTLASPRLGAMMAGTDGRWIINLADTPARDSQFVVFARIIAGWDVVQTIAGLMTENYTTAAPETAALTSVPVITTGAPIGEAVTVDIIDADRIKPQGVEQYWTQSIVYPEGYAGEHKREVLSISAFGDFDIEYEVTVRYQTGAVRDVVIDAGTLTAGGRFDLVLSDDSDTTADLVFADVPYAIEVRAVGIPSGMATPPDEVVSATIERSDGFFRFDDPLTPDSGAPSSAENFFNPAPHTDADLRSWVLGPVEGVDSFTLEDGTIRLISRQVFITWLNLTAQTTTVTVTLLGGATPLTMNFALDPLRRGGAAIHTELFEGSGVTGFFEGVTVQSTRPIAVQFSGYAQVLDDPPAGALEQYRSAFSALAVPGGGATAGILPTIGETIFINPGAGPVDVTIEVLNDDGLLDVFEIEDLLPGEPAFGPEVADLAVNAVAIRYTSTGPIAAFLLDDTTVGLSRVTPFQTDLANTLHFAGGAPGAIADTWELSVYNPWMETTATRFQVRFTFDDGTELDTTILDFGTDGYRTLRLTDSELIAVRAKFQTGAENFSIRIVSVDPGGTLGAGAELGAILSRATAAGDDGWAMVAMPTGPIMPWAPGTGG